MIKLHLGCFDVPLEGWYNADVTMHIVVARIPFLPSILYALKFLDAHRLEQHKAGVFRKVHYLNALKRFPFHDDSVDAVYSSHMLESFAQEAAVRCLQEVRRVLKPGGVVRLAMADLDDWVRSYVPKNPDPFLFLLFQPNVRNVKDRIHWLYNRESLKALLVEAGFRDVTPRDRNTGACPDVEHIDYREGSMYMEGFK